ncbi:retrotransposon protein, putative, ty1-copia subclass [Tanacetum coccineum]
MMGAKFDIEKFDGTGDLGLWRIKMRPLLIQHGCEAALEVLPEDMEAQAKQCREFVFSIIRTLCGYLALWTGSFDFAGRDDHTKFKERSKAKRDDGEGLYVRGRTDRRDSRYVKKDEQPSSSGLTYEDSEVVMVMSTQAQALLDLIMDSGCSYHMTHGYLKGVKGYKLYRLNGESPKIVTSRNVVFNESVMYKDTLKDSGASDKSDKELQVEVELQRQYGQSDSLIRDDSQEMSQIKLERTRMKPLRFQDESNMASYAFAAAEEEDTHEPLTYQEAVACEDNSNKEKGTLKCVKASYVQGKELVASGLHTEGQGENKVNQGNVVKKSLYGLKQSPRQWYRRFDEYMLSNGFKRSSYDSCVDMKELREAKKILGMDIVRDRSRKILRVSQSGRRSIWLITGGYEGKLYLAKGTLGRVGVELNTVAVNCDNEGAIHLSRNHVFHERTKHINVRYHFIREVLEANTVKVLKV